MTPRTQPPDAIERLLRWTRDVGLLLETEEAGDHLNKVLSYAGNQGALDLTLDRGIWSLALGTGETDTFHPDVWRVYFNERSLGDPESTLDEQVDFVVRSFSKIGALSEQIDEVEARLDEIDEALARRFLGID